MIKVIDNFPIIEYDRILHSSDQILESLEAIGCIVIRNTNITDQKMDFAYDLMTRFFLLDESIKQKYSFEKIDQKKYSDVGFFPFKTETAVNSNRPDLKEMFHIGRDFGESTHYATNIFPSEISGFEKFFTILFEDFEEVGRNVFNSLMSELPLSREYRIELLEGNNSLLRLIHYPPCKNSLDGGMRAAPHTGIQLLGIQPKATSEGLEFFTKKNGWFKFPSLENCLIINIGEMMSFISKERFEPTLHRVSNVSHQTSRYAAVHFFHPNSERKLQNIETGEAIKSGEWLVTRLKEIGVYK